MTTVTATKTSCQNVTLHRHYSDLSNLENVSELAREKVTMKDFKFRKEKFAFICSHS